VVLLSGVAGVPVEEGLPAWSSCTGGSSRFASVSGGRRRYGAFVSWMQCRVEDRWMVGGRAKLDHPATAAVVYGELWAWIRGVWGAAPVDGLPATPSSHPSG